jgi:ferritin
MIARKVEDALNAQINAEMYSGYLYLAMSAWFESVNLPGMARWMAAQAAEEHGHAMKIYHYLNERGGRVRLAAIDEPKGEWESPLEAFEDAYAHEQKVTGLIADLVALARKEQDLATEFFLQWFVTEQVEEEAHASLIVEKLRMAGGQTGAMFMLDRELGARGA